MQGVVKVYDPRSGVGVIVRDDDRSEVFLRPGSLEGSMFRMLRQGQRVKRGELIARIGRSGNATTEHCHFEIRRGEVPINPTPLLGGTSR